MPERAFTASYDSTTKVVSAVVCLILIVVAFLIHIIFVALLLPLLIFLGYAYSPRGYALSGQAIVVRRLIGNIRVPMADVREIRRGSPADFTGCVRLWGSGGFFGYYGLFRTTRLGKSYWYMTNRAKTVIVSTKTKVLVLSPDDADGFVAAAGVPAAGVTLHDSPQFPSSGNPIGKIVGIGVAALALILVAMAFIYSPGPPAYTLTRAKLTIHDPFYAVTLRSDAADVANIRVVDLTQESEWRPTLRTNGFANQHYQSGWFRVASGRTVRLYRAGGARLVLIPPKGDGTPVLYQAKDPDRFARELRQQWSGH